MFKIDQNSITVSIPKLNNRKRIALSEFLLKSPADALAYLASFKGRQVRLRGAINRRRSEGRDTLADKGHESVLRKFTRMLDTTADHYPSSAATSWVGVEIECFIPKENVYYEPVDDQECDNCGGSGEVSREDGDEVECECCCGSGRVESDETDSGYYEDLGREFKKDKVKYVSVKEDPSIDPDDSEYFAVEITVLTRLDDTTNLERACRVLKTLGAKVNKSCGLHVHLDARHLSKDDVKAAGERFKRCMPLLCDMVPPSRKTDSPYNRLAVSPFENRHSARYHAVNLVSWFENKTIEVRMHSGTTDFNKIVHWATLVNAIARGTLPNRTFTDLADLTNYVYLPEETMEHCAQRIALFKGQPAKVEYTDVDSTDPEVPEPSNIYVGMQDVTFSGPINYPIMVGA